MSTPSSPASPARSGSPYYPLQEPQPGCDLHSVFCPHTGVSSSAYPVTPSTSDALPSCSHTVTASTSNPSTSETSARVSSLKRSRENSDTEEPGRKKLCKQKHIDSSSPSSSPSRKRSRSSSSSDEENGPNPSNPHITKRPKCIPTWEWAARFLYSPHRPVKNKINQKVLEKIQRELLAAYESISEEEKTAAGLLNNIYIQHPPLTPNESPIVVFKRTTQAPTRLCWKKLQLALAHLNCSPGIGPHSRMGNEASAKTIHWLMLFMKRLHPEQRPRTLISGQAFTYLCGTALAAQNITPGQGEPTPLTSKDALVNLASSEDLAHGMVNIDHINCEPGVVFLRHAAKVTNLPKSRRKQRSAYPIYNFDPQIPCQPFISSSSQTEEQS